MPDANDIFAKWEAICEAASKAPWKHIEDAPMFVGVTEMVETPHYRINFGRTNFGTNLQPRFDARFAAAARTGWPRAIRALKEAMSGLERIVTESRDETMGLVATETLEAVAVILECRDA